MVERGGEIVQYPWHAKTLDEIFAQLQAGPDGLTTAQVDERRHQYGTNELQHAPGTGIGLLILKQLKSPLIYMLLAAAVISYLTGNVLDAWIILAVVVLNTIMGVVQEWRAERALEALRKLSAPQARVIRDGSQRIIPAAQLVPGDVLLLEGGDHVGADGRYLEGSDFHVDESSLTGESRPVEKTDTVLPPKTPLAERDNMVWMTTGVTGGRARVLVVATGMQTTIGEIAGEVRDAAREETPLQHRIAHLSTILGIVAIALSAIIFIVGYLRGFALLEMLLYAVAAAVAAIPEGLPAVISVVLALGVQRMAARNAIIRRLPAVETLGSTTVICTDKTGTLTRNEMTVTRLWAGGRTYRITGEGFASEGEIIDVETQEPMPESGYPNVIALLIPGCLVNDAQLEQREQDWRVLGDPTEAALLVAAKKAGLVPDELREESPRIAEIPFSSKHQYMATLHQSPDSPNTVMFVKGAPDRVLKFCSAALIGGRRMPMTDELRRQILEENDAFAQDALRVLAGAYREFPAGKTRVMREEAETGLVFLGLWGMVDPPRPEAIQAIAHAEEAGIRIVMITGDYATTATAIAERVGIVGHGEETVSGEELMEMSAETLKDRVERIGVFARVSPSDKLRIVNALLKNREIVAMTGDGVNDAPALKRSNIGIAMGITGTEVAKEAADMVLVDDNFATIVNAIEEGRTIFNNLRKVIFFLITTNLGEILTLAAALFIGLPLPLTAVMILWVNLVTDGLCTAPLGVEPGHWNVLKEPPRPPDTGIIDTSMVRRMAILAPLMAIGTLGLFWYELQVTSFARAQTIAFTTLVAFQWFHALNARSRRSSVFSIGFFRNLWLLAGIELSIILQILVVYWEPAEVLFATVPLTPQDWGYIVLVASSIFIVDEILKRFQVHHPTPKIG